MLTYSSAREAAPSRRPTCIALTNNKDGFTTLLALVTPNLMCKPATILYNKVTIKDAR
jgi:5,6,7,8-tetrahydromethanopterin hydro-lyase